MITFSSFLRPLAVFALAAVVVLPGCGSPRIAVDQQDAMGLGLRDRQTGDVVNLGQGTVVPENFPAYIPRFPGSNVIVAIYDVKQNSYNTVQDVKEDAAAVRQKINAAFQGTDFKITNDLGGGEVQIFDYENAAIRVHFQLGYDSAKQSTNVIVVTLDKSKISQ